MRGTRFNARVLGIASCILLMLQLLIAGPLTADTSSEMLDLLEKLPANQQEDLIRSLSRKTQPHKKLISLDQPIVVKPNAVDSRATSQEIESNKSPEDKKVIKKSSMALDDKFQLQGQKDFENSKLKPFGYDLFAGKPTTFAPVTEIPIPLNYIVGPGDTIQIQIYGKENKEYELQVNRDGQIQIPEIGPMAVTGMDFDALKQTLTNRIVRRTIGVKVNVSLGELRSMRVFVMGDVNQPGSYMVSSLSTITNTLFVSGGIKPIGSLRNIQLKRRGKIVQYMDLYKLLLEGDTSNDARVQPGDVIFVPPVGTTVGVSGEVRRPAIYELKNEENIAELLELSGGMLPTAFNAEAQLERITTEGERTIVNINLLSELGRSQLVWDGDILKVYSVLDKLENIVFVSGYVQRPGGLQWVKGIRFSEVFSSVKDLLPEANLQFSLIRRERTTDNRAEIYMVRLGEVLASSDSKENIELYPRDEIFVFGRTDEAVKERNLIIEQLVREQKQLASFKQPEAVVTVFGNVRLPGTYPLAKNMNLGDLLRVAGDFKPDSDANYVLLISEGKSDTEVSARSFDLSEHSFQVQSFNKSLAPRDIVYVFAKQDSRSEILASVLERLKAQASVKRPAAVVKIEGLVRSPGEYPLEEGMTLDDLVRAAGGLTEAAYELEAELSRFEITEQKSRITQHMSVKLENKLFGQGISGIQLKPHDMLQIKRLPYWSDQRIVEISGEVRFPGKYPVRRDEKLSELLLRAGGLSDQAFAEGAVLVRDDLRRKEQEQLDSLAKRLESDLAAMDLQRTQTTIDQQQSFVLATSLLKQLKSTKAIGRLVINIDSLALDSKRYKEEEDVILRDGDKIYIPPFTQEVTILGEVQHATSHLYRNGLTVKNYIDSSGGMTYRADDDRVYIVRANGAVLPAKSTEWSSKRTKVRPGDTIVVPLDAERIKPLALWTNISQILYQLGLAAASWNVVGVL